VNSTPDVATASRPSSRTLLAKYFAMSVANADGGSCPYIHVGMPIDR